VVRRGGCLTVDERTASLWKTRERDSELDALAISGRGTLDGACESGARLLRKGTNVLGAGGVAGHLRSGSGGRGLSSDGSGSGQDGDNGEKHLGGSFDSTKNGVENWT
jgi:hypothetical protein